MRTTLIALITLLITTPTLAGTREYCASKYKNDYAMQEYCIERQNEGYDSVIEIARDIGIYTDLYYAPPVYGDMGQILYDCWNRYGIGDYNTRDWPMIEYCTTRQMEAYRRLNP